ncbi:MAG: LCP family protein [Coriobacteriales bacterium]|jgi:LCP family protein required for cell wall assembly
MGDTGKSHATASTGPQQAISVRESAADYSPDHYHARKGRSRKKKVITGVVIALAAVLVCAGGVFAFWYGSISGSLKGSHNITNLAGKNGDEPYYVLLLGGDSRTSEKTDNRTDSIMVARVDEKNQQVSLLSVPRDTMVAIDGHGYQKINSAIEFGGYDLVIQKINEIMGIQINYYAFIYFDGFEQLVDDLGGVTVSEVPEGTSYHGVTVPAGKNVTINGKQALVLARCRHGVPADQGAYAMGDYQRTLNQRNLIKAIAKKVLASDVTEMPSLISGLSECVETNMEVSEIVGVAQNLKGMDVNSIKADTLPYGAATIDTAWCAVLYKDVADAVLENFRNGNDLYQGLDGFDSEHDGDDIGSAYTEGPVYIYALYADVFGDYTSISSSSSASSSSSSSS